MEVIPVNLGERSYQVCVGTGLLADLGHLIRRHGLPTRAAVIADETVARLHGPALLAALDRADLAAPLFTVPAGEASKSLACAGDLCDRLIAAGLDRHSLLIAFGGGVIGDLAGFVAAIYYRGIPYLHVPTTVVAQVDSSVGGKTGVNAAGGKNLIGAFHQPRLVIADVATLATLPDREFGEGFGEIIKHAIIRDRALFDDLLQTGRVPPADAPALARLIARNVAIKAAIVAADERETTGLRAVLNFGHTVGHAIENAAGYGRYLHGEAVALGMVAAAHLSVAKAGLPPAERDAIVALLAAYKLPVVLPPDLATDAILEPLLRDKKFADGRVRFVLSPAIGDAFVAATVSLDDIRQAVEVVRG